MREIFQLNEDLYDWLNGVVNFVIGAFLTALIIGGATGIIVGGLGLINMMYVAVVSTLEIVPLYVALFSFCIPSAVTGLLAGILTNRRLFKRAPSSF